MWGENAAYHTFDHSGKLYLLFEIRNVGEHAGTTELFGAAELLHVEASRSPMFHLRPVTVSVSQL